MDEGRLVGRIATTANGSGGFAFIGAALVALLTAVATISSDLLGYGYAERTLVGFGGVALAFLLIGIGILRS